MKFKLLSSIIALSALTGCATNEYALYADTQKAIAQARAVSEAARFNALAEIAKTGDSAAKVAAVISLNMQSQSQGGQQIVAAPKTFGDIALQWTSLLLPNLTQIYGINKNADVSISQSNNAALVARSTNEAFVGIASKIQAPQANVSTTNTTTNTSTIGGNNNAGSNSGNSGRVAAGDMTDNTSTPTVVKPEIVNTTTTNTTTNNTNSNNTTTGTGGP